MAKPFNVTCSGLPIQVRAHRISKSGNVYTIEFVRTKPPGKLKRQSSTVRWMLKHLAEANTKYSFTGSIHVLSTGAAESLWPDGRSFNNKFATTAAEGLLDGNFEARANQWECPKCRHFLHCPA
jgi:hypothetical protein